jgi:hypothetical protein
VKPAAATATQMAQHTFYDVGLVNQADALHPLAAMNCEDICLQQETGDQKREDFNAISSTLRFCS